MAVSTRQALLQALSAAGGSYVSGQQLAVSALLHNMSLIHDEDHICALDGREAVSYNEAGAPFHQIVHSLLNQYFRTCIDRTGSFIQNQNLGIRENCTRNGQKLFLPL